ncbi:MAG: nuclear transport factor 2 family protein [Sphingomonadales bacterium]|nr:nuclear transport factor 2 family protein [Sphingomonadales bacterium]MBU3991951.1 nuclear transport factor 2 family protein [Alphaproteobacteria bacterium]
MDDIEAIKQLKGRYFYYLDMKDWGAWGDLFTTDATLDVSGEYPDAADPSQYVISGREAIRTFVAQAVEGTVTVHHGHMPLISLAGSDRASGIWAMEDNLFFPDGSRMTGYGHYREDYSRADGTWRIARLKLTRLRVLHG